MTTQARSWDERYQQVAYPAGTQPAAFLLEVLPLLPRGHALDLALGAGRNAVFLAERGWHVTGVDSSRVALERAEALARQRGVHIGRAKGVAQQADEALAEASHLPRARPGKFASRGLHGDSPVLVLVEADVEKCVLPADCFDVVLCFNYLQRALFGSIAQALRAGGMLVYETYTLDQLKFPTGPRNPDHLLQPAELRQAFPGLRTIFHREFAAGRGIASLLARKT